MKFKKRNVKLFVFLTTILFFISTLVLIFNLLGFIERDIENQPFEIPKENPMIPKPLPSENSIISQPLVK